VDCPFDEEGNTIMLKKIKAKNEIFRVKNLLFIMVLNCLISANVSQLYDVAVFENRQHVTAAKFINKNSLFILLLSSGAKISDHFS
jgi:hypothetical protein